MKKITFLLPVMIFVTVLSAFSQKYKTPADTIKLNKEYLEVSSDITKLTADLKKAQDNLSGYHNRASEATSDAQSTALASSNQASKTINGDVGDAKKEKRKAKKALRDAKDARSANNKLEDQDKKIAKLSSELEKKQGRLQELDEMRTGIRSIQQ
jgi:DNA repair exonuclease SbcCD ATPase subunit